MYDSILYNQDNCHIFKLIYELFVHDNLKLIELFVYCLILYATT
jgi:hypothetical protein